uniref:Hemoglobin subunit alpha-D n=1 Tax=Oncorhynchus mykiss TaxID=8022 RepID=C1BF40_ONCMY|nr:Hemoglobin subunit alpha-D [Oncorhynchus mykiss]
MQANHVDGLYWCKKWLTNTFTQTCAVRPSRHSTSTHSTSATGYNMLTDHEKELIAKIWDKMIPVASDIGAECLLRMMTTFPGTKTYFAHLDIRPRSPHLRSHGKKIVLAIAECSKDISSMMVTLAPLQTLHVYKLRIDPCNFKLLCHCILVTLAAHMGDEFDPVAHAAMDKYLSAFAAVLAEKYR